MNNIKGISEELNTKLRIEAAAKRELDLAVNHIVKKRGHARVAIELILDKRELREVISFDG